MAATSTHLSGCCCYCVLLVSSRILCFLLPFPRRTHLRALLVFILYVRSTAINPADPGIMYKFDSGRMNNTNSNHGLSARDLPGKFDEHSNDARSSLSSTSRSSIGAANTIKKGQLEAGRLDKQVVSLNRKSSCCRIGGAFCFLFVHEDCRRTDGAAEEEVAGEDALFCTLCNAEVRKFSKHCRSCDKCVDGFDHHCRVYISVIYVAQQLCWEEKLCYLYITDGHQLGLACY